jgi:hypothetical protein
MYKALSIHKIRQNTKMPTFYKTLYLLQHDIIMISELLTSQSTRFNQENANRQL